MPSEPIPKFDGKASTFATFIMEFVGYAILQIDGVKYLHALEQNHDPNSWYTMKAHVGTGTNYHYEDTEELSAIYEEQVDAATCPAYPLATTQAERKEARAKDKLARRLLAAALRNACKASSTAAARMQKSDPMDGVSGLLVLRAKYANTTVSVNRSVSLRQAMWSEGARHVQGATQPKTKSLHPPTQHHAYSGGAISPRLPATNKLKLRRYGLTMSPTLKICLICLEPTHST